MTPSLTLSHSWNLEDDSQAGQVDLQLSGSDIQKLHFMVEQFSQRRTSVCGPRECAERVKDHADAPSNLPKRKWRCMLAPVERALITLGVDVQGGHAYEFGIFNDGGETIITLWRALRPGFIWGIGPFEHVIDSSEGDSVRNGDQESRQSLVESLGKSNVDFITSSYNALTEEIVSEFNLMPAKYIGIGLNPHENSLEALQWALRSGVVVAGTLIAYNDFWAIPCSRGPLNSQLLHPFESSEGHAHLFISQKYDVEFVCLSGPCRSAQNNGTLPNCDPHSTWGAVFLVVSIGQGRGCHGFELSKMQIEDFVRLDGNCNHLHPKNVTPDGKSEELHATNNHFNNTCIRKMATAPSKSNAIPRSVYGTLFEQLNESWTPVTPVQWRAARRRSHYGEKELQAARTSRIRHGMLRGKTAQSHSVGAHAVGSHVAYEPRDFSRGPKTFDLRGNPIGGRSNKKLSDSQLTGGHCGGKPCGGAAKRKRVQEAAALAATLDGTYVHSKFPGGGKSRRHSTETPPNLTSPPVASSHYDLLGTPL